MTVIACLQFLPDRAGETVLDICSQLTPIVEPDGERIWMDWTGCGAVPALVEKLTEQLTRVTRAIRSTAASTDSSDAAAHPARYRLGIAPLRFVAGAAAARGGTVATGRGAVTSEGGAKSAGANGIRTDRRHSVFVIDTPIVEGCWITDDALPELLERLPISALPELDAIVPETLAALDVRTLGDLSRIPRELLYSHIGRAADKLLDWARGRDEQRVRALYPPERLERRISAEVLDLTGTADAFRVKTAVFHAAAELAAELEASRRACAGLAVTISGQRLERTFTPPVTDPDQLSRTIWRLAQQLLTSYQHDDGDCIIIITPANYAGKQMTLWASDRLGSPQGRPGANGSSKTQSARRGARRGALEHPALAAIRARFGHVFRIGGGEAESFDGAREALERYEAMCRFYG